MKILILYLILSSSIIGNAEFQTEYTFKEIFGFELLKVSGAKELKAKIYLEEGEYAIRIYFKGFLYIRILIAGLDVFRAQGNSPIKINFKCSMGEYEIRITLISLSSIVYGNSTITRVSNVDSVTNYIPGIIGFVLMVSSILFVILYKPKETLEDYEFLEEEAI